MALVETVSERLRRRRAELGLSLTEFHPRPIHRTAGGNRSETRDRLKRLFWDHPLAAEDLERYPVWVVERVLDFGNLDDIRTLRDFMGNEAFLRTVAMARRMSPRTRTFWRQILELEGISCTRKYSRDTAWIS